MESLNKYGRYISLVFILALVSLLVGVTANGIYTQVHFKKSLEVLQSERVYFSDFVPGMCKNNDCVKLNIVYELDGKQHTGSAIFTKAYNTLNQEERHYLVESLLRYTPGSDLVSYSEIRNYGPKA